MRNVAKISAPAIQSHSGRIKVEVSVTLDSERKRPTKIEPGEGAPPYGTQLRLLQS